MKRYLVKVIMSVIMTVFILVGCGSLRESSGKADSLIWSAQHLSPGSTEKYQLEQVYLTESYLYAVGMDSEQLGEEQSYTLLRLPLNVIWGENAETKNREDFFQILPMEAKGRPLRLFGDDSQNIYLVTEIIEKSGQGSQYILYRGNLESEEWKQWDITQIVEEHAGLKGDESFAIEYAAVDSNGNVFLAGAAYHSYLWMIDEEGQFVWSYSDKEADIKSIASLGDDSIYAVVEQKDGSVLLKFDGMTGNAEKSASLPRGNGRGLLAKSGNGGFYYGTREGLFQVTSGFDQSELLFKWTDLGIDGNEITDLKELSQENIVVVSRKWDNQEMTLSSITSRLQAGADGREKIVLGGTFIGDIGDDVKKYIGLFNVSQSQYEVVVKEYNSQEQMLSAILAGGGPDLMPITGTELTNYVKKGLLEDLNPYLDQSENISRDKLVENVLDLNTVESVLACIPPVFAIDTMAGRVSDVGGEIGWTYQEFFDILKENEGKIVVEGTTFGNSKRMIIDSCMHNPVDGFVDYSKEPPAFRTEDFRFILDFADQYMVQNENPESFDGVSRIRQDKTLLYNGMMNNVLDFLFYKSVFQEDITYIGYPTKDGAPCFGLRNIESYAIRSGSKVKEGAWMFLEFLITQQTGMDSIQGGFPTLRSALDEMITDSKKEISYIDENSNHITKPKGTWIDQAGEVMETFAATQEDIDFLWYLIENASYIKGGYGMIDEIVYEESSYCLEGERSVEETVQIIENRIQLYLNEQQ